MSEAFLEPAGPAKGPGRPTKLTPDLQQRFVQALRSGCYRKDACAFVGINASTCRNWQQWGREDPDSPYGAFLAAVLEAEQQTKQLMTASILTSAGKDWKAAAWWLERKFPADFGRVDRTSLLAINRDDDDLGDQLDPRQVAADEWDARYVDVDVRDVFLPHDLQRAAITCDTPYLALVCGVGGGKTRTGALNFWKRVKQEDDPRAYYMLVAPDTVNGQVMCEHFVEAAPAGWITNPAGSGPPYARCWQLVNGARVQFRSADKPEKIVARRVNGMWIDEFTLMKSTAWRVSLRGRLVATGSGRRSWAIFTGTPRGKGWAWEDVWRRTLTHDDKRDESWTGYTWPSEKNPAVDQADVDAAKRDLPAAYYEREWQANWETFHGQIYEHWNEDRHTLDLSRTLTTHPRGAKVEAGFDWGFAKPGAMVVGRETASQNWELLAEVHVAKKLPDWWEAKAIEAVERFGVTTFWCDPAEPDRIVSLRKALRKWANKNDRPCPRAKAARNEVKPGIRHVAGLFKQDRIRVHVGCVVLIAQLTSYQWKQDRGGEDTEEVRKESEHTVDALRYMIWSSFKSPSGDGEVVMGGAGGKAQGRPARGSVRGRRRKRKRR